MATIQRGVPFERYASIDAANAHGLLLLSRRTPAHLHHELTHGGSESTPALAFGALLHRCVLEPDLYRADCDQTAVSPPCDRRYKEGKMIWARFVADNEGKTLYTPREFEDVANDRFRVEGMRDSIFRHPTAREALISGVSEATIVWDDDGLPCKARLDHIGKVGGDVVVIDLKSTEDASRRAFERAAYTYGYHVQAAHYLAAVESVKPTPAGNPRRRFLFIVVEKAPPFAVAVYEADDQFIDEGEQRRRVSMDVWRACRESGVWPAYPDGAETLSLPPWVKTTFEDQAPQPFTL